MERNGMAKFLGRIGSGSNRAVFVSRVSRNAAISKTFGAAGAKLAAFNEATEETGVRSGEMRCAILLVLLALAACGE
jgi:hypothetical protein